MQHQAHVYATVAATEGRPEAGKPANATKGLVPQPQPADAGGDSSDEEQDLATAILAGQAW